MALEVDHVFICCTPGSPEADVLIRAGFCEGPPNTHPGQGTACRRFFFRDAYLELLWVTSAEDARSQRTVRTQLWERWSARSSGASPFGLVFRPAGQAGQAAPFTTWKYRPSYLPHGLAIEFAEGVPLEEPALIYLPFASRSGPPANELTNHSVPLHELLGVTAGLPKFAELSVPSKIAQSTGLITYRPDIEKLLELSFFAEERVEIDFRPSLPLILHGIGRE